jgi:hypothetical protein
MRLYTFRRSGLSPNSSGVRFLRHVSTRGLRSQGERRTDAIRTRVPPSERAKPTLTTVLGQGVRGRKIPWTTSSAGGLSLLVVAFEQAVNERLGRAHARLRRGWRDGDKPKGLKTPLGTLPVGAPGARDRGAVSGPYSPGCGHALEGPGTVGLAPLGAGALTGRLSAIFSEVVGVLVTARTGVNVDRLLCV